MKGFGKVIAKTKGCSFLGHVVDVDAVGCAARQQNFTIM